MFTGIVETTGKLQSRKTRGRILRLRFALNRIQNDMKLGDSLAVNGVCLTVVDFGKGFVDVDAVSATLKSTALGDLKVGDPVNFELSLKLSDRLGGHWVQGHVDGVGTILRRVKKGKNMELEIQVPDSIMNELIAKASVAVNGVSLTIQSLNTKSFSVAIIPHTSKVTNLGRLRRGDRVNIEVDILSKYVKKYVGQIPSVL